MVVIVSVALRKTRQKNRQKNEVALLRFCIVSTEKSADTLAEKYSCYVEEVSSDVCNRLELKFMAVQ
jgi:hypothetical protein